MHAKSRRRAGTARPAHAPSLLHRRGGRRGKERRGRPFASERRKAAARLPTGGIVAAAVDRDRVRAAPADPHISPGTRFVLTVRRDTPFAQLAAQPAFPVFEDAADHFVSDVVEAALTFERDAGGRVTALVRHQSGCGLRFKRAGPQDQASIRWRTVSADAGDRLELCIAVTIDMARFLAIENSLFSMKPRISETAPELRVRFIRGQRVVLDRELATLYGVQTKRLNEAVRRNAVRFPADFCFQLTAMETVALRAQARTAGAQAAALQSIGGNWSQYATSSSKHRGATYRPWAFTEHGALMAATVLSSPRAVQMSLYVVRAFVRMREELATSAVILRRLAEIDRKLLVHDVVLRDIYAQLRPLLRSPARPRRQIGFHTALKHT